MSDDNSNLILQALLDLKKGQGEMSGKLDATIEAHRQRFEALEQTVAINNKQQWVATVCILPIVGAIHYLATKINIIKS
jgi:hypothetical protein